MKHKTCMLEDIIRYFDLYYCHLYTVCYFVKANESFYALLRQNHPGWPWNRSWFFFFGGEAVKAHVAWQNDMLREINLAWTKDPEISYVCLSMMWYLCFPDGIVFPSYGINGLGAQAFTKLGRKKKALWHQAPSHCVFFTKGNVFGRLFISN